MPKHPFPAAGGAMPTTFITVRPSLRTSLATTIDSLIALLDEIDGDENLEEPGDEEPTLGWPAHGPSCLRKDAEHDDRELEDEHDEDGGDREPDATESECNVSWVADADVPQSGPNWYSGWELAR